MPKISTPRKILFILILAAAGLTGGLAISAVLIWGGWVQFEWTQALRERIKMSQAQNAQRRMLVLGDSFLAWWGELDHFLNKDLIQWGSEHGVGVIVRAWGGFGPYEYLDQMQTVAPQLKPDLVLMFYYCGNDLTDLLYRPDEQPRRPQGLEPFVRPPEPVAAPQALRRLGGTLTQLASAAAGALSTPAWAAEDPTDQDPLVQFDWEAMRAHGIDPQLIEYARNRVLDPVSMGPTYVNPYLLVTAMTSPDWLLDNLLIQTPQARMAWRKNCQCIIQIVRQARTLGSRVVVVCIPSTVQVDRSHEDFYRKAGFHMKESLFSSRRPQQMMEELCGQLDIPMIDLLPVFCTHPTPALLYWENDDHLSPLGHQAALRAVREQYLDAWAQAKPAQSSK